VSISHCSASNNFSIPEKYSRLQPSELGDCSTVNPDEDSLSASIGFPSYFAGTSLV